MLVGNIDQVQYTDKIKGIVEFTGHRLSLEELTKIWKMQVCVFFNNIFIKNRPNFASY